MCCVEHSNGIPYTQAVFVWGVVQRPYHMRFLCRWMARWVRAYMCAHRISPKKMLSNLPPERFVRLQRRELCCEGANVPMRELRTRTVQRRLILSLLTLMTAATRVIRAIVAGRRLALVLRAVRRDALRMCHRLTSYLHRCALLQHLCRYIALFCREFPFTMSKRSYNKPCITIERICASTSGGT